MADQRSEQEEVLRDGSRVTIRPLREGDLELEREFIVRLSPQSRRFRFLYSVASPTDQLLKQLMDLNDATNAAFIALAIEGGAQREIGVARMSVAGGGRAEFAVAVSDDWQRKGLGTLLTKRVMDAARRRGISALFSVDASDNYAMQKWAQSLGFERATNPQDATEVIHTLALEPISKRKACT